MYIKSLIIIGALVAIPAGLAAQNVGIGTTPTTRARLELHGSVGNTTAIFGADANGVGLGANWPTVEFNAYYNGGYRYIGNGFALVQYLSTDNGSMVFEPYASGVKDAPATGQKAALAIVTNGRVGIGFNTGFNAQLNVGKDADKAGSAYFAAPRFSAFNYTALEHTYIRGGDDSTRLQLNYYAQNSKIVIGVDETQVSINTNNYEAPVYPLQIYAPDLAVGLMRIGSLNQWIITPSQYYLKFFFRSTTSNNVISQRGSFDYNSGQYSPGSDRRIKKQIEPLPPMLEKLMQLQPCSYEMKYHNLNHDQTFGFIAQEVKEIFPSLVHVTENANTGYDDIKDFHTLNYSGFAPIVIKALQEQQAQLKLLEERTARLEKK
ncbi:MAG: tail fiber domain-containing protein [Bacteroidota bacterium]